MGRTAQNILSEELLWAQDRILHEAVQELSDNLDSFPVFGFGFSFMKRSAEKVIMRRVREDVVPDMMDHLRVNLAYIEARQSGDDPAAVKDAFRDDLLDGDPLWDALNGVKPERKDNIRADILDRKLAVLDQASAWVAVADGQEFDSFTGIMAVNDIDRDDVLDMVREVFFYVDMMEQHRDCIDPATYSTVLEHDEVKDWFLDHLLTGLKRGRDAVVNGFDRRITRPDETKEWRLLDEPSQQLPGAERS